MSASVSDLYTSLESFYGRLRKRTAPWYAWASGHFWKYFTVFFLIGFPMIVATRLDQNSVISSSVSIIDQLKRTHSNQQYSAIVMQAMQQVPTQAEFMEEDQRAALELSSAMEGEEGMGMLGGDEGEGDDSNE